MLQAVNFRWKERTGAMSDVTVRVFLPGHKREDGLGVVVRLLLARRPRVLAVVGQLVHAAQVADGVAVRSDARHCKGYKKLFIASALQNRFEQIKMERGTEGFISGG